MNRSFTNVLFGAVGAVKVRAQAQEEARTVTCYTPEDAAYILENAQSVMIIPGYGMAVAQAQHAVQELAALLLEGRATVRYAIHPVAGRMPGHMNVLLAEANVPYGASRRSIDHHRMLSTLNRYLSFYCDHNVSITLGPVISP